MILFSGTLDAVNLSTQGEKRGVKRQREEPEQEPNLNFFDALVQLAEQGDDEEFKRIIRRFPILVNIADEGNTLLLRMVAERKLNLVTFLVELGADVNRKNPNGITPLMTAVEVGVQDNDFRILQELLQSPHINLNVTTNSGDTALHYAASVGSDKALNILLARHIIARGLHLNLVNKDGFTPLSIAIAKHKLNAVKKLIQAGADVNRTTPVGNPLILAIENRAHDVLDELLEAPNINMNFLNSQGESALILAATQGDIVSVNKLLAKRANVNITNFDGNTPLIAAIWNGHNTIVERLLQEPGNIDHRNKKGQTALMIAAYKGNPHIVELLLQKGAKTNIKASNGMSVFDFVQKTKDENRDQIMKLLHDK